MVVGQTAMVMARSALVVIGIRMGVVMPVVMRVRHAVRSQRNLRVLQGMGRRGQGQDGQTGEPPDAEVTMNEHSVDTSSPPCSVKPMRCSP